PFEGIAKPEPLKYDYQGAWSRRIDAENWLIYMVEADQLYILSLKDHYG
ncbi:Txe/YoeB family addiction module toxin, partial [Streptococcus suis]